MQAQKSSESNSGMTRQQTGGSNIGAVKKQSTPGRSNPGSSEDIKHVQKNNSPIRNKSGPVPSDSREGKKSLSKESSGIKEAISPV